MSTYGLPDPTGTNPLYLRANIPFYIYQNGMQISFENSPIYAESLVISLTDGTSRQLVRNVDWEVRSSDVDQTATSRAKLEDNSFNKVLAKSITIISDLALDQAVAMTFQNYYQTIPGRSFDDGTPYEVTPDLIKDLDRSVADIRQQMARVVSPVTPNLTVPKLLPFDINGQRLGNRIVNEKITVNTVSGGAVIRLAQGAFFRNSVTIVYNGQTLSAASDYSAITLSPLTKKTTNPSGIYQHILLNGSFAGDVFVSYHAVGGDVQVDDINAVYQHMVAIQSYLNDGVFVTSDSLSTTPSFRAMFARIVSLEDDMRRLLTGNPTYGDASSGAAVTRPVGTQDADLHWFTIASLYRVEGSNDIIRADQFKGRVYFPGSKISLAFTLDFNMDQSRNVIDFTTDSVVFDPTYTLFGDLSVNAPQYPLVRAVWNQAAESFSGVLLQVGVPLPTLADLMVVENMSSSESCWILDRSNEFVTGQTVDPVSPRDSGFLLPDDVSIWSTDSGVSYEKRFAPEYEPGYLVYSGAQNDISSLVTITNTGTLFNLSLPVYFPIETIKELVITVLDDTSTFVYDVVIPLTGIVDDTRMGRMTFADSSGEALSMEATLTRDNLDVLSLSLNVTQLALPLVDGVASPKTDIVRYVRARV
jgi:hypothetical protein